MIAIIKTKKNGNVKAVVADYRTKLEAKKELRANGFAVLGVFTEQQIHNIKSGFDRFNESDAYEYIRQCL